MPLHIKEEEHDGTMVMNETDFMSQQDGKIGEGPPNTHDDR